MTSGMPYPYLQPIFGLRLFQGFLVFCHEQGSIIWVNNGRNRLPDEVFRLLESEVLPMFYDTEGPGGLPRRWVQKIKASMKTLAPQFNATRMVQEYEAREQTAGKSPEPMSPHTQ